MVLFRQNIKAKQLEILSGAPLMPFTKHNQLHDAVQYDNLSIIEELCTLPKHNAPEEKDITKALNDAALAGSVKVVKYLCEKGGATQEAVTDALIALCKYFPNYIYNFSKREEIIRYLCALTTANRPKQKGIELAAQEIYREKEYNTEAWKFFKTLCELPVEYAPSQRAVGNVLLDKLNKGIDLPYDVLTHLFEKSTNKPEQAHVCAALKNIYTWKKESSSKLIAEKSEKYDSEYWEYINYLCDLTGENKPNQETIELIFKMAFNSKKVDLLGKLLILEKDYAPRRKTVAETLCSHVKYDWALNSLDLVKLLCENSINKLTNDDITEALVSILWKKSDNQPLYFEYLWNLTLINKPKPTTIDKIVEAAANVGNWVFVKTLCESKDYPPSGEGVGAVLKIGIKSLPFDELKYLFETSTAKPNQYDLSTALIFFCSKVESADSKFWEPINYLLALKASTRDATQTVLNLATKFHKDELIRQLCMIEGRNAPSVESIEEVLINLVKETNDSESFKTIKFLCENSINQPRKLKVSDALKTALIRYSTKKDYVIYLSSLTTGNRPPQDAIDNVLIRVAESGDWEFVKTLCANKDNPPSQAAIGQLLKRTANLIFNPTPFDLMTYLFDLSITKPSQVDIDATLALLPLNNPEKVNYISYLCDLKGRTKPSEDAIKKLFTSAVSVGSTGIVEKLALIDGDNELDQALINSTLIDLADKPDSLNMIKCLCELKAKAPNQGSVNKALLLANSLDAVRYFCELKTANAPSHEAMLQCLNNNTPVEIANYLKSRLSLASKKIDGSNLANKTTETQPSSRVSDAKQQSSMQTGFFYHNKRSCFSLDQIAAIEARIDELVDEIYGCLSFLYVNKDRKQEKIDGLSELLRIGLEPRMTIAAALERIEKDSRFPDLRTGTLSNRTADLLDQLKASDQAVVSNSI
jgi:hypothetical protein